jgi:hypothetical protein
MNTKKMLNRCQKIFPTTSILKSLKLRKIKIKKYKCSRWKKGCPMHVL